MRKNAPVTSVISAFLDLSRTRIAFMVLVSCAMGFILAYRGSFPSVRFVCSLIGTGLLSSGACALNCYIEREYDALMPRTAGRPIPIGIVSPEAALVFGAGLILSGCVFLFSINLLSGLLGTAAVFLYLAVYTPAKRLTWLNTSIGSLPGAIPPLIGWASATGQIEAGGWILFVIMFVWQHTHFFPIAWLYKDDYRQAGFQMLPALEASGDKTFLLTVLTAIALIPISMLLYRVDFIGYAYYFSSLLFGILLVVAGIRWLRQPSRAGARAVLLLSLVYLPAILTAIVADRYGSQLGNHFLAWLEMVWPWT